MPGEPATEVTAVFRQRKPTLIDRLPAADLATSAGVLRERALDAAEALAPRVEAAREAMAPRLDAAREALAPHVDAAKATVTPKVAKAREAVGPKAEAALSSLGPSLALAATALDAARSRAEQTAQVTEPTRREAALRGRLAAAALRGERPPRRGPSALFALGLGVLLGLVAGIIARRMTTPVPLTSAFGQPSAGPSTVPTAGSDASDAVSASPPSPPVAPPTPAAPPPPATPPTPPPPPPLVDRNDETAVDLSATAAVEPDAPPAATGRAPADQKAGAAPRRPSPRPRPRKDEPGGS